MLGSASLILALAAAPAPDDTGAHEPTIALRPSPAGHYVLDVRSERPVYFGLSDTPAPHLRFILDTGATQTAIAEPIASQLGFVPDPAARLTAHGLTAPFETQRFSTDGLDFGFGPQALETLVLFSEEASAFRSAGLLALDAFPRPAFTIDFPNAEVRAGTDPASRGDLTLDPASRIPVGTAATRGVQSPVRVMIDTGSNVSLVNTALVHAKSGRLERHQTQIASVVTGEDVQSEWRTLMAGLDIGGLCMGWFYVSVADVHAFDVRGWSQEPAIILGMDVLRHVELHVDIERGVLDIEAVSDHRCAGPAS